MIDDGGFGTHEGETPAPPTSTGGTAAAAAATNSAPDGIAAFTSRGSHPFPSDEDSSTGCRPTMAHFETGESDSFDSSSFSSSPGKNYVTPDQSFFPSASSRPIRSNPGSNGSSPSRRALTRPVPSGKTPPRAPATSYTSFLRPRGLQGRVLFAPKGAGVVSVGVPSSDSSTGSSQTRQQRPFPVQQVSSSAQPHQQLHHPPQGRINSSMFSERGRKRRAYSANGPFSSSLSNSNARIGAGVGEAVARVSSSPSQLTCQRTPHPMSPGSIGLEGMSIHSPQRDGHLQQSNNYINEAAAGAPPPPPPSFSPENDTQDNTNNLKGHESITLPPSNRSMETATFPTSRRGSSNSSHDVLSGANTPTTMLQTPQTSPRRGGSLCPSSALGSIGGSSVGGGSCFGPYRSRTPSPNPLMLLGGRPCHRRQGSGTSHISSMSGLSSALAAGGSDSNPLDTSFDTSTGMSSADVAGGDEEKQHEEGENGEPFTSPSPLKLQFSPKHVPVMVLTKSFDTEENDRGINLEENARGPKSLGGSPGQKSQKDQEPTRDLDRLLDVALHAGTRPTNATAQSQVHPAQPTAPLPPTGAAPSHPRPSPGGSVRGFNLSPRRPLPASMTSPGGGSTGSSMLERSPMIETPAWAVAAAAESSAKANPSRSQRNASAHSSPGSFLSPRRTAEDGRLADLLFGEDDPPSPLLSSSRRGLGTTSKADSSKPPPFPSTNQFCANNGDDMGAVMDGLLSGFNKGHGLSGKQRLESSNSLAFSMGSSTNSLDRMKVDDGFPIKTLSFGGDHQSATSRHSVGTRTTPGRSSSHTSLPLSSSQTTPRRNGASSNSQSHNAGMQLPPGFMVRSVLTPSKSGGSLQKLMDAHRARSKGVSDLDDGSLSDSCDGSQGSNDMFFLNSPEEVAAATIHAEVENTRAESAENSDEYAGGRAKKRRSMADSKSSHLPTMPMEISETCGGHQGQSPSEETNDGGLLKKDLSSSSSSSTLESTKLSARQSGRQGGGARSAGNVPKLKKARSVTFSPSPEVSHSMATMNRAASSVQVGGQRILSQTSSSSLYGMDIVQEEPSPKNDGENPDATASNGVSMSLNAASAVTPHQNTDSTDPYYFAAISSKSRSESGETLSTPSGSHCNLNNLQDHNKRQSFGSSGSLLAHFNNLNRQESEASLNWGIPSYYGVARRASSRAESALGLPIGHDEDESQVAARPPSSAKAYTPPARDLITPPAQTFSLGIGESTSANKCRGMGRRMLSPPPLPSKWPGTDFEEDGQSSEAPIGSQAPNSDLQEGRNEQRRKHLCIASADKDAVRFAIARMEADNKSTTTNNNAS